MHIAWTVAPAAPPERVLARLYEHGSVAMSVGPPLFSDSARTSKRLTLTVCVRDSRPVTECLESWPREAIAEARRLLDTFAADVAAALGEDV